MKTEIERNQAGFMLRQIRRVLDIKQIVFASLMGVTEQTVVNWEQVGPKGFTLNQLQTLYSAGINPMYLCGSEDMFIGGLSAIKVRENMLKLTQVRIKGELQAQKKSLERV